MINSATLRILDQKRKGNYIDIEIPNDKHMTNEDFTLLVYAQAAIHLDTEFYGEWHYAYAELKDGTHGDTDDLSLIKADGFNGQFQFKSGATGGWVPMVVSFDDPEADQARDIAAQTRAEEERLVNQVVQGVIDGLPSLEIIDLEAFNMNYEANKDSPYGVAVLDYADRFGRLLQAAIRFHIDEYKLEHTRENVLAVMQFAANILSNAADFEGISGSMHSFAVAHLGHCWRYGSELSTWNRMGYSDEFNEWQKADPRILDDLLEAWANKKNPFLNQLESGK